KKTIMLHLTTTNSDNVMLQESEIILIKSWGKSKTKIFLRGVEEGIMVDASFEDIKFAINNNLHDLLGIQAETTELKLAK
ncbi:TPA: hypothetical protein JTE14_005094, partial [Escherichia coli]|nr:hypothetical protein [Escherichia coli]HAX9416037.1 hypothetical protein [Escherichia coli]HBY5540005.1 hypothetical protein [Klebsiella pneumoniae]